MANRKRKVLTPQLPMQRQFLFPEKGRFFDLRAVFDKINAKYFRNRLRDYTIIWGRRRKLRPKTYMVFGTTRRKIG